MNSFHPSSSPNPAHQQRKVLILERLPVDAFTATAIPAGNVPTLAHKQRLDPVEPSALVVQPHAGQRRNAPLAGAQGPEVLRRSGDHIGSQLDQQPTNCKELT